MGKLLAILVAGFWWVSMPVAAQDLSALARVLNDRSGLSDQGSGISLKLGLSQGVPFRVFTLDEPRRLVLDFNEVDWAGLDVEAFDSSQQVDAVHTGLFKSGWSRMVLVLDAPLKVNSAELSTTPSWGALVQIDLIPTTDIEFQAAAGVPKLALYETGPKAATVPDTKRRQNGDEPLVVVLDPGHGGIDPGAESNGAVEAELMLAFALELQEVLRRAGTFKVTLTRTDNGFVPLEARVSIARRAGADVFLSLHADALVEGRASGATIYTLSERASDLASQKLAERHDRSDLLAGVDLSEQDDVIANVLMELARVDTAPRSDKLADALVAGLSEAVGMHKRPRLEAGFSVLKAPDIPSVLIELGFLSSPRDRKRLQDTEWRAKAAGGIRDALAVWAIEDAAEAALLRK